jgi:hypothetical protein
MNQNLRKGFNMIIKSALAASLLAASLFSLSAQTQDLFRVTFRVNCLSIDASGQVGNSKLTEKDVIAHCVNSQGLSNRSLTKNYALVYNPAGNNLEVVRLSDGSLLCDVIEFQDVGVTSDSRQTDRFSFMFIPDQINSIGTAVITQKSPNNDSNRVSITGKVQFVLTGDISLGSTNTFVGTNATATTNGLSEAIAAVEGFATGATNIVISGTNVSTVIGTNVTAITNGAAADTNVAIIGTNVAGIIASNVTTIPTTNVITADANSVFSIGAPVLSGPATSAFGAAITPADTNSVTTIDTNSIATNAFSAITDTNLITTNAMTNLANVRICSGTFTASRRLTAGVTR